ncbi:MAG: hypothetical protein M2R45_03020 [Verrucomicrobia subdivision 3 bacterium]|nr:hypothetical protein [Limisphaerales bacterium]MCS1415540.1 hypothetical protein [Limisphaerales bacterium]
MTLATIPIETTDPVNSRILKVSEDRIQGFHRDPIGAISEESGVERDAVVERLQAMLHGGTIRRIRQTLLATNLARGALVAWQVPPERLDEAFGYMFEKDPFSGHVVTRSTDNVTPGSTYKLWTTLKVPEGYSMERHCAFLASKTGAEHFRLMPAKRLFTLGVGHVRRRGLPPGSKSGSLAQATEVALVSLTDHEWKILTALKRECAPEELEGDLWALRAGEGGVSVDEFCAVAKNLNERKVIGRFSTFLEHVKTLKTGEKVTRFNALFHWAVPEGMELKAGMEVGRHHIMTHAYWREGGPEFRNVNVMGVAHGTDKALLLEHKAAIDSHLQAEGIPVTYTNVFWGGRSEIKPSEISPFSYREWCEQMGVDPDSMKA